MRVVAGSLRGRPVMAPPGHRTRPTTDRVREAVFNALSSLEVLGGANVMDLYAGSGALGIEALSRGAQHCTFVERDREAVATIRRNIADLDLGECSTVIGGEVLHRLATWTGRPVDLVLVDPPYDFGEWDELLVGIARNLREHGLVVIESGRQLSVPTGWDVVREKRYGRTWVVFLRRSAG